MRPRLTNEVFLADAAAIRELSAQLRERGSYHRENKKGYPAQRAYFTALRGNNRTLIYDTPNRKGVRRDVVKRRGEGQKMWFECEGFGYEIVR